jgi:hypothetical protein
MMDILSVEILFVAWPRHSKSHSLFNRCDRDNVGSYRFLYHFTHKIALFGGCKISQRRVTCTNV